MPTHAFCVQHSFQVLVPTNAFLWLAATSVFAAPMCDPATPSSREDISLDVQIMRQVADLMHRLLMKHPLSHGPQLGNSDAAPHGDSPHVSPINTHGSATDLDSTESWPTPKPAVWHDIELSAARVCACLEWLLAPSILSPDMLPHMHDPIQSQLASQDTAQSQAQPQP